METIKTMAGISYVFDDGRKRCWEMKSIFQPDVWLPCPDLEEEIVKAVNRGVLKSRYEGHYQIFTNVKTGEDEFRRY